MSESERFWSKVDRSRGPVGCWPWLGASTFSGAGRYWYKGKMAIAYRVAWELCYGPIPKGTGYHGTVVRHKCDNPICVAPFHLELGDQKQNMRDKKRRRRPFSLPTLPRVEVRMKGFAELFERYTARMPGGCLVWTGPTSSTGSPLVCLSGRMQSVVRRVLTDGGEELSDADKPERACGTAGCVERTHWRPRPNPEVAAPPPPRKFDVASAEEVRRLHASGTTMAELARRYRVNYKTVLGIIQGKKYVPKPEEKREILPVEWEADRQQRGMSHRKYADYLGLPLATYQRKLKAASPSAAA